MKIYNCKKKILYPPNDFIEYNYQKGRFKDKIQVDTCIADEIEGLWNKGIKTTGCCCGHGAMLGFIEVTDECIEQMEELGYIHYIYPDEFGGAKRKDAYIPKSYGHIFDGFSDGFLG